ncbi:MAG: hypothetical protein IPJ41_10115 [Phycisphaerales bacterium]|nr:hypothetical protein [Phycisphaerales bacterium]
MDAVDSEPDDDSTVSSPTGLTTADLWYYGPVFIAGSGDGPYTIESRVLKPPSQLWTDVSSDYTVSVVNGTSRHVLVTKISGQFPVNREYRFVPFQSGGVKLLGCDEVAGNPPVHDTSADDHSSFSIPLGTLESLDFSDDGVLDDAEITPWLIDQTDLDRDGEVTDADYAALDYVIQHEM